MSEQAKGPQVSTLAKDQVGGLFATQEPQWLKERRLSAWESYLQAPMPTVKNEDWRSTTVNKLDLGKLYPAKALTKQEAKIKSAKLEASLEKIGEASAVYMEDYATSTFHIAASKEIAEKKITVLPLAQALAAETTAKDLEKLAALIGAKQGVIQDKFTLMNTALSASGLYVHIPKNTTVAAPVVMALNLPAAPTGKGVESSDNLAVFPKVIVHVEANSTLKFVSLTTASETTSENAALVNAVVEFHVEAGARVEVAEVTNLTPGTFFVNRVRAYLGRDAQIDFTTAGLGGGQVKSDLETVLEDRGAQAAVKGIVLGAGKEHYAYNTIADHKAPDTTSNIVFRVALKDSSTSIYQGNVIVDKVAQRTDAYQSNKNLLLSRAAKADSIPKLEILADDVKCSHGATVSPVDRDQLFYLMSRGLTRSQSEELIVTGFFQQVLDLIPISGVKDLLAELAASRIEDKM